MVQPCGGATGVYRGGVYRVGSREGYTGYYPATLESGARHSEAGPGRPAGPGVGGVWCSARPTPAPTPQAGPVPCGHWCSSGLPGNAASWPIRARFDLNLRGLSQNGEVSLKYVDKASHSPYLQNGHQSHLLEFPDFHFQQPSLTRN